LGRGKRLHNIPSLLCVRRRQLSMLAVLTYAGNAVSDYTWLTAD
jgi:hypothetical protein